MQIQCNKLNNVYFMIKLDLYKISCLERFFAVHTQFECDLYCKHPLY